MQASTLLPKTITKNIFAPPPPPPPPPQKSDKTIVLRNFQEQVIEETSKKLRYNHTKSVVIIAPTAAGKTVMMAAICKNAISAGSNCLILVDMDVLVSQTFEKFIAFGIEANQIGFIKAGYPENRNRPICIASIQTLARRKWDDLNSSLILFDECHVSAFSNTGSKIIEHFQNSKILGFTATPWRLKRTQWLQQKFNDSVLAPTPRMLQKMGYLSKMEYFTLANPDLKGVSLRAGDYKAEDLEIVMSNETALETVIKEWQRLGENKPTLAFCVNVAHAHHVAKKFNSCGIPAKVVTGETPKKERELMYDELAQGKIKILSSVMVVSIGFDLPIVQNAILLRPTKSKALHIQQIGRVMRIAPGKQKGRVLDFSGNCIKLGLPEDLDDDDYDIGEKKPGKKKQSIWKECPECHLQVLNFASECPHCGYKFPAKQPGINNKRLKQLLPKGKTYKSLTKQILSDGIENGFKNWFDKHPEIFEEMLRKALPENLQNVNFKIIGLYEQILCVIPIIPNGEIVQPMRKKPMPNNIGFKIVILDDETKAIFQSYLTTIQKQWGQLLKCKMKLSPITKPQLFSCNVFIQIEN